MKSSVNLKWGIIGCGDVTEIKSGPAFNKVTGSELYAVMRRNAEKAADYAFRHNIPVWYTDAYALINDPAVDAVYVATPPSSHEEYAVAALRAGKPVYVEKPMATDASACRRMAEAAIKYDSKLVVAHYRRAMAYFIKIKELINEIGKLRSIQIKFSQPPASGLVAQTAENWRVDPAVSGGGLFHDLAPHHLDLMNWFFGPPVHVQGFAANQSHSSKADDIVAALLVFKGDLPLTGTWSFAAPGQTDRCEIEGAGGSISFAFHGQEIILVKNGAVTRFNFNHGAHIQQPMIEKVLRYFRGETEENPCPPEEGILTMQLIDKLTTMPTI